jgi:hypothetical protein
LNERSSRYACDNPEHCVPKLSHIAAQLPSRSSPSGARLSNRSEGERPRTKTAPQVSAQRSYRAFAALRRAIAPAIRILRHCNNPLRYSQAFAAGMLPLLKMARAKLDQHMQQQQKARASPAPVGSDASSAEEKARLNNTSPVVPLIASQKPLAAAVIALSGSSQPHPFSPAACPRSGGASPLPSLPTPGTLVKSRAASASAPSLPPPRTPPAATPALAAPPKLLSFAAAGGKSALSAVSPRLLAPKSARSAPGGGWSASAFASSRPRGLVLHEEPRQDDGVISALSAGADDVGSIGACSCHVPRSARSHLYVTSCR